MASEVQHIIALSLNKIMASRSRRGGVSLHRNLLVASVLLRAKDAYIAETVAKRKKDMDAEAVVPNLECPEVSEKDQTLSEEMESDSTSLSECAEENLISMDAGSDCSQGKDCDSDCCIETDSSTDNDIEFCEGSKENVDPNISYQHEVVSRGCSRKRRYNELDSESLECDYSSKSTTNASCYDFHEHSDISEKNGPCRKHMKVDLSVSCNYVNSSYNYEMKSEQSSDGYTLDTTNSDADWSYDCDNCELEKSSPEHITYPQTVCLSLTSADQSFTQQANLCHTNLLLVSI